MNARQFFDVWPMAVRIAGGVKRDGGSVSTLVHGAARLRQCVADRHGPKVANEAARWVVTYLRGER